MNNIESLMKELSNTENEILVLNDKIETFESLAVILPISNSIVKKYSKRRSKAVEELLCVSQLIMEITEQTEQDSYQQTYR